MSTEALQQAEQNMIKNLEEKTGKSLAEWIEVVKSSGLEKHGELVALLKKDHSLGHGYANMIVHHAKQSSASALSSEVDWVEEQYKGKESIRPWYDKLMAQVQAFGPDVEVSPKKAYVSLRRKKQFALVQPSTKTRIDIGLNLKNVAPEGALEKAGSWNTMCTHRIKIEDENAINPQVVAWIKQAYEAAG